MTALQPVRLDRSFHERVWGIPMPDHTPGKTFGEIWHTTEPPLPILVKFIFTSDKLSVQVHPDGECGVGKTEMWHILSASTGAEIALGFKEPIGAEAMRAAALSGHIERLLRWIPVHPGETYFIPAGTIHAIGSGITLCEIQQNSDITYRLYDYGRPRELHLDRALEAADLSAWSHPGARVARELTDGWKRLVESRYFTADSIQIDQRLSYQPDRSRFELLIFLEGSGRLNSCKFGSGDVWLLPAASPPVEILGEATLLRTYVPSTDA